MRLFDISRPVGPGTWVWPGDRPLELGRTWKMEDGASVNVGHVTMSVHAGTHMDAPYHCLRSGATSEQIDLAACIGPCVVTTLDKLAAARGAERILVRANGGAPTAEQIGGLAPLKLFGTDFHSVDPLDSTTLDAHHALWRAGAVILEELVLDEVPEGAYELIALPLKLVGMDGAPVRAVLVSR